MSDLQTNMVTLGVYCLQKLARAYFCCRRVCRPSNVIRMELTHHTPKYRLVPGDEVPSSIVLETWKSSAFKKSRVHYAGESIPHVSSCPDSHVSNLPWVWIGFRKLSEEMVDLTEEMSQFAVRGNIIKPELVHTLFPHSHDAPVIYVDSKSFETVQLSSYGLVIGDEVPPAPSSSPENVPSS